MKKLLLMLLGVLIALPVLARDFSYKYEGQTLTYTVLSEAAKTVKTKDGLSKYPYTAGNSVSGKLILPEKVYDGVTEYTLTGIGDNAFDNCSGLTSVTIPNSITSIGKSSFYGCSGLTSVIIPNYVTSIGADAFKNCSGLKKSAYPSTLSSNPFPRGIAIQYPAEGAIIEDRYSVWGPDKSVLYFVHWNLSEFIIPESVTSIGSYALKDCILKSVTIPNSVTSIGKDVFSGCSGLTKAEFASIEHLCSISFSNEESNPLYYAKHLYIGRNEVTDLVIPETVTAIGNLAFINCSNLTSVTIPNSVTSIGFAAFKDCSGLTKAEFASIEHLCSISFLYSSSNPLYYAKHLYIGGNEITDLVIPETVKAIDEYAFEGCSGLTSVTIPSSVTSIGWDAFDGCSGLKKAKFASIEHICSISFSTDSSNPLCYAKHLYIGGNEVTNLVIPETVKAIGDDAFINCNKLTSVTIPNSVTSIGREAFQSCSGLTSVTIPNSVTSIGSSAFEGCSGLKKSAYPSTISENPFPSGITVQYPSEGAIIEDGCVWGADKSALYFVPLNYTGEFIIPNSVTSIGENAFYGCSGLKKSAYPSTISNNPFPSGVAIQYPAEGAIIEDGCVWGADKSALYFVSCDYSGEFIIPNSVTSIGSSAFYGCSGVTSVTIPNSVTSIGDKALYNCSGLTSVIIGNSVTSIGSSAFDGCSGLTSVTIPNSVTSVGTNAFYGCNGLKKSAYPSTISENPFPSGIAVQYPAEGAIIEDGCVWGADKSALYFVPLNYTGDFIIPESVTSIGSSAFSGCSGLTSVTIPNSVTSIGEDAFKNCTGLTDVYFNAENCKSCGSSSDPAFPSTITTLTIGNIVKTIPKYTFYGCSGLTSVTIPNSVSSIGEEAFYGCSGLNEIIAEGKNPPAISTSSFERLYETALATVPENSLSAYLGTNWSLFNNLKGADGTVAAKFTDDVFKYRVCSSNSAMLIKGEYNTLTSASIPQRVVYDDKFYTITIIDNGAFENCTGITTVSLPKLLVGIRDNAFNGCTGLTSVAFPETLVTLGNSAFSGCSALTSVTLPSGLETLGDAAFKKTTNLASVTFNDKLTSIGASAFENCTALTSITLPTGLETLGDAAFKKTTNLASVTFNDNLTSIGDEAFSGCTALTSVTLPEALETLGDWGFNGASNLASVTFNDKLTSIGAYAFIGCSALTSVTLPNGLETLGIATFQGATKLASVTFNDNLTSIGISAFRFCDALTSVTLPEALETLGNSAFEDATNLASVTFNDNLTSIGAYAFKGCAALEEVNLPTSLETLGLQAFSDCNSLRKAVVTASVSNQCFYKDAKLTTVTLTEGVESVKNSAFSGTAINDLTIADGSSEISISSGAFPSTLTTLYLGRPVKKGYTFPKSLTNLTIGNRVTQVTDNAFSGCTGLATLALGSSVKSIGASAFENCALTEVVMTPATETIGANAFAGNNLTNIAMGAYVTEIGEKAFDGSNSLAGVSITAINPPNASNNTFSYYGCPLYLSNEEAVDNYYNFTRCWYRFEGKVMVVADKLDVEVEGGAKLTPEQPVKLIATISPANATLPYVFWRSTNPDVAVVDNEGKVTLVNGDAEQECKIIAETLYANGPVAEISLNALTMGIEDIMISGAAAEVERPNDIYTLQGVCLKRNATDDDIRALTPGLYIIAGKKVLVK